MHAGRCRGWIFRRRSLAAAAMPISPPWADRAYSPAAIGDWPPVPRRTLHDRRRRFRRNVGHDGSRIGRRRSCRYHRNRILRRWRSIGRSSVRSRAWWNKKPEGWSANRFSRIPSSTLRSLFDGINYSIMIRAGWIPRRPRENILLKKRKGSFR